MCPTASGKSWVEALFWLRRHDKLIIFWNKDPRMKNGAELRASSAGLPRRVLLMCAVGANSTPVTWKCHMHVKLTFKDSVQLSREAKTLAALTESTEAGPVSWTSADARACLWYKQRGLFIKHFLKEENLITNNKELCISQFKKQDTLSVVLTVRRFLTVLSPLCCRRCLWFWSLRSEPVGILLQ